MKKNVLVSVIINCYNGDSFLKLAIDSVLNQTYRNIELVIWDNLSNDKTDSIINSYNDKRIKYYLSSKHEKLYKARNLAIDKCRGDVITFLDCDDLWFADKIEKQIKKFKTGHKFIYGKYVQINSKGDLISRPKFKFFSGRVTSKLLINNFISIGTVMVDSSLIKYNLFDPKYNLLGDFELWVRLSLQTRFCYIDTELEYSRIHENNTSKIFYKDWIKEKRYFYKNFITVKNLLKYPSIISYILVSELKNLISKI